MTNKNQVSDEELLENLDGNEMEEKNAVDELRATFLEIQKKVSQALEILSGNKVKISAGLTSGVEPKGRVIEGVFDGQHMVGQDGKQYLVPPNYASKSKLVEGDILKLTITDEGAFIYKQIGPIARLRITGVLERGDDGEYFVSGSDNQKWKLIPASVTFFKANPGDEAVILVPQNMPSKYAALENVIKNPTE